MDNSEINNDSYNQGITPLPSGSLISLSKPAENVFQIHLPAKKFGIIDLFPLMFSVFWLGFVAVWTILAASGGIFFVLFSLPFWAVGGFMLYNFIISINEEQILTIESDRLKLQKNRRIRSKSYEIPYKEISSVGMKQIKKSGRYKAGSRISSSIEIPVINYGKKSLTLFDYASEGEKVWVANFLKAIISRYNSAL